MTEDNTQASASPTDAAEAASTPVDSTLAQLQNDLDRFRDLALRTQADFENFRKRAARDKDDAIKYANAAFLDRLIPILDNFELGLNAARSGSEGSSILLGMDMVAKQLGDFLVQCGVEPLESEGVAFDPNLHEAIGIEQVADEAEDDTVVTVHPEG